MTQSNDIEFNRTFTISNVFGDCILKDYKFRKTKVKRLNKL